MIDMMEIELKAKCGKCGYIQVLKGFEQILEFNKHKPMKILYKDFLLVNNKNCSMCEGE